MQAIIPFIIRGHQSSSLDDDSDTDTEDDADDDETEDGDGDDGGARLGCPVLTMPVQDVTV